MDSLEKVINWKQNKTARNYTKFSFSFLVLSVISFVVGSFISNVLASVILLSIGLFSLAKLIEYLIKLDRLKTSYFTKKELKQYEKLEELTK